MTSSFPTYIFRRRFLFSLRFYLVSRKKNKAHSIFHWVAIDVVCDFVRCWGRTRSEDGTVSPKRSRCPIAGGGLHGRAPYTAVHTCVPGRHRCGCTVVTLVAVQLSTATGLLDRRYRLSSIFFYRVLSRVFLGRLNVVLHLATCRSIKSISKLI